MMNPKVTMKPKLKVLGDKTLCLLKVPAYLLVLYSTVNVYCNMYFSVVNVM